MDRDAITSRYPPSKRGYFDSAELDHVVVKELLTHYTSQMVQPVQ
jgi:hypothetical protein